MTQVTPLDDGERADGPASVGRHHQEVVQTSSRDPPRPGVIACPYCAKRFRWMSWESCRARCPACNSKIVVLVEKDGACAAFPEDPDFVDEMFCDWLGGDIRDREDNEDDDAPEDEGFPPTPQKAA